MSEQQLAEILARANAATAGPWCTDSWEIYQGEEYVPGLSFWIGETCRGTADLEQDRADAAFVAAARTDVPALVAEVSRLRAERRSTNEALSDAAEALQVQRDRIAELEAASRQWAVRWQERCNAISAQGLRWKAEAEGRKEHGEKLAARIAELEARLGREAEQRHLMDALDHSFEALALPHPTDAGSAL
ncbi:hypothetical protein [Streptomyces sp. NPDC056069]|uniref:hypothetical protein n=1 Tax=Streptomyces sp. NPDC056069 TaxID=3345702 RepID=UPI0035D892E3